MNFINKNDGHMRSQTQRDDDDSLAEADAKQQEIGAINNQAEWNRRFNPFEGIVHEDDGTSWNFGDGKPVGGVNNYLKLHKRARADKDDAEEPQEEGEVKAAKPKPVIVNEDKAMKKSMKDEKDKEEAEFKRRFNEFDGSFHNDDGSRTLPDG